MRVCYFGSYDPDYVRNRTMTDGLRRAGTAVIECHVPLWRGTEDRVGAASRPGAAVLWRTARAQARLVRRYARTATHDVLVVGYPGHVDVPAARLCSRLRRHPVPVVFDAFLSLYETAVEDRGLARSSGLFATALRAVDRVAVAAADLTLLDTDEHVGYFRRSVSARARYATMPVSAEDAYLSVPPLSPRSGPLRVAYFGGYIPLHGVKTIISAAALLRGEPLSFLLIGRGQMLQPARQQAEAACLANVRFDTGWYSVDDLAGHLADADVCLGVFGTGAKAMRVVPNKVVAALASGRPVVTADTPAMRALLQDDECALLCPPGDATALAQALLSLSRDRDRAERIGTAGRALFQRRLSVDVIGRQFHDLLQALVA